MEDGEGKRKVPEVDDEASHRGSGAEKARASRADGDADSTDVVILRGRGDRSGTNAAVRAAAHAGGDDIFSLATSSQTQDNGGSETEDTERDSPLVVANPPEGPSPRGDQLIAVDNPPQLWPQASPQLHQEPDPRGSMTTSVIDEVDRLLPLGLQERAAASAVRAAVQAASNSAAAAAAIAGAGWHVPVSPSRNHPVHPLERCSSCGLRKGVVMADHRAPHRCLCVECLLDNAVCPVCHHPGPAGCRGARGG